MLYAHVELSENPRTAALISSGGKSGKPRKPAITPQTHDITAFQPTMTACTKDTISRTLYGITLGAAPKNPIAASIPLAIPGSFPSFPIRDNATQSPQSVSYAGPFRAGVKMGSESRAKATMLTRLKQRQPLCIYCGGTSETETIDHFPPRGIFLNNHRPKGLEFGACEECNAGSRKFEQLVQCVTRFNFKPSNESEKRSFEKMIESSIRHNPGLAAELFEVKNTSIFDRVVAKDFYPDGVLINAKGPILNGAIKGFAAKLGLALHYERTGRIVPTTGFVVTSWFSNFDAATGRRTPQLVEYLSEPTTLKQGTWEVSDQFRYSSAWTSEGTASAHLAVFGDAFAVQTMVGENAENFRQPPSKEWYRRPGFLKGLELPDLQFRTTN